MLRNYECILILDPDVAEEQKEGIVQKIRNIIAGAQGEVEKIEDWGRRELSYNIKRKTHGVYLWLALKMDPKIISELESDLKINETVLRHLILVREAKSVVKIEKAEEPMKGGEK